MLSRFAPPARQTRVKTFRQAVQLRTALEKVNPWVVLDGGVPTPFDVPSQGLFFVRGGESSKRWNEVERVLSWLASQKAERSQPLAVIGGGATLDLGALAASLYRRGMPLILVPTTLLAMVDATLGGKTAVDLEQEGRLQKNFAGTFYPASEVWILPDFLRTLPARERVSGAGEVFKTMWIQGKAWSRDALLDYVSSGSVSPALGKVVQDCLAVKARLVARDPLDEKRVRELLNFGHTVGHALESASQRSHGECVLWGMLLETRLLGARGTKMAEECAAALGALSLDTPPELESVSPEEWLRLLGADKKNKGGKIELSLLASVGKSVRLRVTPAQVVNALRTGGAGKRNS